jgi:pyridoxamine 5'-phosphate oxidase
MTIKKRDNPLDLFHAWFDEADRPDIADRTAMTLATADEAGTPSARIVLLKLADDRGFVFYTNAESQKGKELTANPQCALCFYWAPLGKQVRIRGSVDLVSVEEADEYFASRDRRSQIGAWASAQSRAMDGRFALEKEVAVWLAKYAVGTVPRPPHWVGYRLRPEVIEFWQSQPFRLHDRLRYRRVGDAWETDLLFP